MICNNAQKAQDIAGKILEEIRDKRVRPEDENDEELAKAEYLLSRIINEVTKKRLDWYDESEKELANGEELGV